MRLEEIRPSIWDSVIEVMEASLTDLEFDGEDIEIDWRIGANARKMDRELYEQYGVFKDVILDERFQRIKTFVQDNVVLDFNFILGDPLMPLATSIVILFLMHKRVSNDLLALAGAFVFNVNPFYVVLFYIIYNLTPTWTGNSKPKQFVSAIEQTKTQASRSTDETVYDHVLIGADIGTLYTAALLARVGHSCCVLQPADVLPLEILPNPSRSDLPSIPTKNLSIGKIERYQVLFDMLCSSPEDFTRRFTFSLIGSDDGSFTHTVMKMRKTISNVKKDLWCLRPDELSLASDVASKLLLNKNRLEAFLIAVSRTQDFLSHFLNSRAVPSSLTLSVAKGELAKQIYNLASESISSTYGAFKIAAPVAPSAAASAAAAAAGTGTGTGDGAVGEAGVNGQEAEAVDDETEEENDVEAVQLLLERVAIVGADEMTIVPSDCSGLGLALALTQSTIGSFYPEGGPGAIAAFLRGVIEKAGGRIVTNVSVKEIDTKGGEDEAAPVATGVLLRDGTRFAASKSVISGTGLLHTYQELLTKSAVDALTPNPLKEIEDVVESAPRALVFFWLEGSAEECGLSGADYVDFGGSKKGMLARLWSPSAKDSTWELRHPKTQAVVVELPDSQFVLRPMERAPGAGPCVYVPSSSSTSRSERSYLDAARRVLSEVYPQAVQRIVHERHFVSQANGRTGIAFTKARFTSPISAVAPIPGLYFCGKDLATAGLAGDMQGGYVAACAVLGYSKDELVGGRNVAVDIQNLR